MKLIFLDVDGVLNSTQSDIYYKRLWRAAGYPPKKDGYRPIDTPCPIAMSNLKWITEECPDVRFVLSSTWRINKKHRNILKRHFKRFGVSWDLIIGDTPVTWGGDRSREIHMWIRENLEAPENTMLMPKFQASDYVILDDLPLYGFEPEGRHYRTDPNIGLTITIAAEIVRRFKNDT